MAVEGTLHSVSIFSLSVHLQARSHSPLLFQLYLSLCLFPPSLLCDYISECRDINCVDAGVFVGIEKVPTWINVIEIIPTYQLWDITTTLHNFSNFFRDKKTPVYRSNLVACPFFTHLIRTLGLCINRRWMCTHTVSTTTGARRWAALLEGPSAAEVRWCESAAPSRWGDWTCNLFGTKHAAPTFRPRQQMINNSLF